MNTLQFIAWIFVHIAIPIFAPIALLPLLGIGRTYREQARGLVYSVVKDGQLFWPVIAMSAGATYELAGYLENASGWPRVIAWTALVFHVVLIIYSAVLVMLGAIDSLDRSDNKPASGALRIVLVSIVFTVLSALTFAIFHFVITGR
ncbi:hypothetical protein [Duganella levis]|uniref:DUF2269 family protein n=1 Tax=Duganella levis TaxID=2692169 RepID=A0ABW9W7Z9_9BURK|nr:hypothetical protein [Duganella levis]MYN30064.1 hypothetical protein [Duganella levis]